MVSTNPDFGPDVVIIDPSMPVDEINALIAPREGDPFRQIFFMPGTYGSDSGQQDPSSATDIVVTSVPENTAIAGLGASPTDTRINGALYVDPAGFRTLSTFYRSLSNMSITPIQPGIAPRTMNWVTSQTTPFRRVNLEGDLDVEGRPASSPGFGSHFANTRITGDVFLGSSRNTAAGPGGWSQGMYFLRNCELGGTWDGFGGMYVFCGVEGAPQGDFGPETDERPSGDTVTLDEVPVTREAPFLYLDGDRLRVFVPRAMTGTHGIDWAVDEWTGESIAVDEFYLARSTDTAAQINEQLGNGKHLILTPGVYALEEPIAIDRAGTVVLGLGFATLVASAGTAALVVGDAPGVILSGFKIDAGTVNSEVLLQVGAPGVKTGSASDPTTLTDIHIYVPDPGRATTSAVIDQDHVLIEGSWIKRGDRGWTTSLADHGLIVNGDHVTVYGMWLEHYQKTQIFWNGNDGRVIFLQNEPPYDPPSQAAWMDGSKEGYPFLKVADDVTRFRADAVHTWARMSGAGDESIFLSRAIETPVTEGVTFHSVLALVISYPDSRGGFRRVFNDVGAAVDATPHYLAGAYPHSDMFGISVNTRLTSFPDGQSSTAGT